MSGLQLSGIAHAAFDAVGANVAVLDQSGRIVLTNRAWSVFAADNGGGARCGIGVNYIHICRAASGSASLEGRPAADGISAVLNGETERFELEYPCHGPDEERWFLLIATPIRLPDFSGAVVAHAESTRGRERFVASRVLEDAHSELRSLTLAMDADRATSGIMFTPPQRQSLRHAHPGVFDSLLERYCRMITLYTDLKSLKLEEPIEIVEALARELVDQRRSARDVVELHTAAMMLAAGNLPSGITRSALNEARGGLIRLLGLMLNSYLSGAAGSPTTPIPPACRPDQVAPLSDQTT
ncbi:MAG: hypothetical protein IOD15_00550 [Phycisphaerales bacterium]|jgi:hypothetical protein|nr:hypothetical protein [Phycisphaerales bacterium]